MFPEPIYLLGIPFHLFGILAAAGLFAGYAVTGMDLKRQGIEPDFLPDLALAVMMSAFLAARLYYVILHFNQYAADPMGVFRIWEGGMVLHAGILGGLAGGFIFCRGKKFSFLKLGDSVALALALGFAIGRLGCFFAACCFGRPTELPWWGITFHNPLAVARPLDEALHPTQLYFFAAEMALFTFLLYRRTRKSFDGEILLTYLGLSSLIRLVLNPLRADFQTALWVLPFLIFICSLYGYVKLKKNKGGIMNSKPLFKMTVLGVAAIFLAACGMITTNKVTRGHDIASGDVNQIAKGQTTETEIMKMFGPPTKVRDTEQGKEFYYEYTKAGGLRWNLLFSVGGSTVTKTLLVWLDKQGVVTDYAYKKN